MTAEETREISALRKDLGDYHDEVRAYIVRQDEVCRQHRAEMRGVVLEIYGHQPANDQAPGIKRELEKLRQSYQFGVKLSWLAIGSAGTLAAGLAIVLLRWALGTL